MTIPRKSKISDRAEAVPDSVYLERSAFIDHRGETCNIKRYFRPFVLRVIAFLRIYSERVSILWAVEQSKERAARWSNYLKVFRKIQADRNWKKILVIRSFPRMMQKVFTRLRIFFNFKNNMINLSKIGMIAQRYYATNPLKFVAILSGEKGRRT